MTQVRPIASPAELDAVYAMDSYGTRANISAALFRAWHDAYPPGFLVAFTTGRPVGVIGLFPVTPDWAEALARQRVTEHELSGAAIARGAQDCGDWYLSGISIDRQLAGSLAGGRLCARLICECLARLYTREHAIIRRRGIRILSTAATEMGRRLLARHDFVLVRLADAARKLDAVFAIRMDQAGFDRLFAADATCAATCDPVLLARLKSIAAQPAD